MEACAEDTKGQTCYICTEAVHRHTGEGLVRGCACHTTEGFVHISCLAEQAKILVAEAEENNLDDCQWHRWSRCRLCEQDCHGVVLCAMGWACWKTYVGRPERNWARLGAITELGNGLGAAKHHEDALTVREAELSMARRQGAPEVIMLNVQSNLAGTYQALGRKEQALHTRRDVYSGFLKLKGGENEKTLVAATNYARSLINLKCFDDAKALMRNVMPVARRVLGENREITLRTRWIYARAFYEDPAATFAHLCEAVATLENTVRIARRVLGGAHPTTTRIEGDLRNARAVLATREG